MSPKSLPRVLICCGGGTDSTALIDYYLRKGFAVQGVHFDYGQVACFGERRAVSAIADYYRVPVMQVDLRPALAARSNGEFPARNALFVLASAGLFVEHSGLISLGIHSGTQFYDCGPTFVTHMQQLLDGYLGGRVVLDVPFLSLGKAAIYSYCQDYRVPDALT